MRKLYLSFALTTVVLTASAAPGAPESGAPGSTMLSDEQIEQAFAKLDANHDGAVDADEAAADENLVADFDVVAEEGKLTKARFLTWFKDYYSVTTQD